MAASVDTSGSSNGWILGVCYSTACNPGLTHASYADAQGRLTSFGYKAVTAYCRENYGRVSWQCLANLDGGDPAIEFLGPSALAEAARLMKAACNVDTPRADCGPMFEEQWQYTHKQWGQPSSSPSRMPQNIWTTFTFNLRNPGALSIGPDGTVHSGNAGGGSPGTRSDGGNTGTGEEVYAPRLIKWSKAMCFSLTVQGDAAKIRPAAGQDEQTIDGRPVLCSTARGLSNQAGDLIHQVRWEVKPIVPRPITMTVKAWVDVSGTKKPNLQNFDDIPVTVEPQKSFLSRAADVFNNELVPFITSLNGVISALAVLVTTIVGFPFAKKLFGRRKSGNGPAQEGAGEAG